VGRARTRSRTDSSSGMEYAKLQEQPKGKARTVDIPDFDTPFLGAGKRVVLPASRSACNIHHKCTYQLAAYFCKSMGLRSVPPCFGISRALVVWALFSLLIRDAVMKCVQCLDRNPSTAYKTRISSLPSRRVASARVWTYPIKFENFAGSRRHGSLGDRLKVKLPRGKRASVLYAKLFLRRCLFGFGPFRRNRAGQRFGRRRRRRRARGGVLSCSNGCCNVFLFESFENWMSSHGTGGEGRVWRSGSLVGIRIRYCAWLVGGVDISWLACERPSQRWISARCRRDCCFRAHLYWWRYKRSCTCCGKLRTR